MLTQDQKTRESIWVCTLHRAPVKSLVGTLLYVAEPVPEKILESGMPIHLEYYNEHPDFCPPLGSILEGWGDELFAFDECQSCHFCYWRPMIAAYPALCDDCLQPKAPKAKAEIVNDQRLKEEFFSALKKMNSPEEKQELLRVLQEATKGPQE